MHLRSFRNFAAADFEFSQPWTVLTGPNGSGKTNVLEAIFFLCRQRGFRGEPWNRLASWSSDHGSVEAIWTTGSQLRVVWGPDGCRWTMDGDQSGSRRQWVERLPIFGYLPEDDLLFHGEPEARRRALDWVGTYVVPDYAMAAAAYDRALRQRNAVLRDPRTHPHEWDVWDAELASTGATLTRARATAVARWSEHLAALWASGWPGDLRLLYVPGGADDEASALSQLHEQRAADRERGWTARGPHRDDLAVLYADRPIRQSGSQGYRKLAVILMAIAAQCAVADPTKPRLLFLDDVEGELDATNEQRLFDLLARQAVQLWITGVRRPTVIASRSGIHWIELYSRS